ncbi:MAG: KilA-N domain-containing protein [Bacteroidales bacterium]
MAKSVTVTFNGNSETFTADADGMFNLNRIHRLSGSSSSRRPSEWVRNRQTQALLETFNRTGIPALKVNNGGSALVRGVWAIEEVLYAYAEWLSPEFHRAVIDTFTAAANGDAVRAVKVAQSVVRVEGIGLRKAFCSQLGRHKATKGDYGSMTDIINIQVLGVSSSTKRRELGIKESAPLRDHLTDDQLLDLAAAEALAAMMMNKNANRDRGSMREAVYRAVELIKTV